MSSLFLRNKTRDPVTIDLNLKDSPSKKAKVAHQTMSIPGHSTSVERVCMGYNYFPDITATVKSAGPLFGRRFEVSGAMPNGSAQDFFLDITDKDIHISPAGPFDTPGARVFWIVCVGLVAVPTLIGLWRTLQKRRYSAPELR